MKYKSKEICTLKRKDKIYRITNLYLTFLLHVIDRKDLSDKKYYFQISSKDIWWIPKRDTVLDGEVTLWGWLFLYFGCDTKMLTDK